MGWDVTLEDRSAKPVCSYGMTDSEYLEFLRQQQKEGYAVFVDQQCEAPCYPAVSVEIHQEGSTYAVGGTTAADISITYNYGKLFRDAFPDTEPDKPNVLGRMLDGKRAGDVVETLTNAVEQLGTTRDRNYWLATPGNAGYALSVLLRWAKQHPDAVFNVR